MEIVLPGGPEIAVSLVALALVVLAIVVGWRALATRLPLVGKPRRVLALCMSVASVLLLVYALADGAITVWAYLSAVPSSGVPIPLYLVSLVMTVVQEVAAPLGIAALLLVLSRLTLRRPQVPQQA